MDSTPSEDGQTLAEDNAPSEESEESEQSEQEVPSEEGESQEDAVAKEIPGDA